MADLEILRDISREAGWNLSKAYDRQHSTRIKADGSLVSKVDKDVERFIYRRLQSAFPGCSFLGEEGGLRKGIRGGMLLDLGTHALTPLIAAGVIPYSGVDVVTAGRYILGENRNSYIKAPSDQPEMYAKAHLTVNRDGVKFPVEVIVGKTFEDGGIWHTYIRGSNGEISMGLRTGQRLSVISKDGVVNQLKLNINDPYGLAFQEADMYFRGYPGFDGNLQAMLSSIEIIERIKEKSSE